MIGVVRLALGPVGERHVALVDPIEGGEVILDGAQPDGQLNVAELDQVVNEFALLVGLDAEQLAIVLGAAQLLRFVKVQRLRADDADALFVVELEPALSAEGDEERPLGGGRCTCGPASSVRVAGGVCGRPAVKASGLVVD